MSSEAPKASPAANEILDRALRLSEAERRYLVEKLRETVQDEDPPTELSPAWRQEIARRLERMDRGEAVLHDGEQVLRELLSKYKG
jgi:putative addiction module component (TIGR02574 family)